MRQERNRRCGLLSRSFARSLRMDSFPKDECIVCGSKTTQCCSCKLPFCSAEHEALVSCR